MWKWNTVAEDRRVDSGQAKCPMAVGCRGGAGLEMDQRRSVQVEGTAWVKSSRVEREDSTFAEQQIVWFDHT